MTLSHFLIPIGALLSLMPFATGAEALSLGAVLSLGLGNPYFEKTGKLSPKLLALSIVALGAGMDLHVIGKVGLEGIGYTAVGICGTLLLGTLLGRLLKVESDTSLLVTVGTAICGGSAIAALASTIRAKQHEVSVALATVFFLNAIGLLIFPWIGHHFSLSQTQFGLWSALAIHDTSSVVGATLQYGAEAVRVGTTVKLARALWIVPVCLLIGFLRSGTHQAGKAKRPWFILGFLGMAGLMTFVPAIQPIGHQIDFLGKRLLILTLFLIGANLTRNTVRNVGFKPFIQGMSLWCVVASTVLVSILLGWIH